MTLPESSWPMTGETIVCIDDEPAILSSLRRLLRNEPYQFLTSQDPDEAMDWILQKDAALVLADQRMPRMTGLEFLELVKICSPSTQRVLLTGHSGMTGILKLETLDAIQRLIRKPWDGDDLKRVLRGHLLQRAKEAGRTWGHPA